MLDGPRVPRPVADVPPAALADGRAVAKGWLLELVAARPLANAPELPVADLAARGPAAAVAAVAALRRAVWAALTAPAAEGGTGPPDPGATAALAERVAHVADMVAAAVLARPVADDLAAAEEPWRAAVERRLDAHRAGGAAFALLVVEAADA